MPAMYVNNSKRVFVFDKKFIIPGGDAVELTDAEEKAPLVQKYIKAGYLSKAESTAADSSKVGGTADATSDPKNANANK